MRDRQTEGESERERGGVGGGGGGRSEYEEGTDGEQFPFSDSSSHEGMPINFFPFR